MNLILSHLNGINRHIQFTVETEENGCLPYLDLKISRNSNGSLSFDVYRKPTHTNDYLKYNSYNPKSQKRSVVSSLFWRSV